MSLVVVLDVLAVVVVLALLAVAAFAVRRRLLTRGGGSFDCSLRLQAADHGKGWVLGVARYAGDSLEWYRVFSYSMRPRHVIFRHSLHVLERRDPMGVEAFALLAGSVVVRCRDAERSLELAMHREGLTGFLAWVEASPPGRVAR